MQPLGEPAAPARELPTLGRGMLALLLAFMALSAMLVIRVRRRQ